MPLSPRPGAAPAPAPETFAATDQCVLCGLCLPHCPTYAETGNEADSPRGRIALIQALARGELPADGALRRHLDGCLTCRACEDSCPSGVPYGRLIDAARAELRRRGGRSRLRDLLAGLLTERRWLRRAAYAALRLGHASGLWRLAAALGVRRLPRLGRFHGLLGHLPRAPLELGTARRTDAPAGRVYLFTGCASEIFDRETLRAARRLLQAWGYEVVTPPAQTCCGALHLHSGDGDAARRLARTNLAAFGEDIPVIATSSACAATLREYEAPPGRRPPLDGRAFELSEFLAARPWPAHLAARPHAARAAVHTPCSQRRVLHSPDAARDLLGRVPELELVGLAGNERCCGAAGSYMIEHPRMADALAAHKVQACAQAAPQLLVTTNVGCALHLAHALAEHGQAPEILHPATLLARQLGLDSEAPLAAADSRA